MISEVLCTTNWTVDQLLLQPLKCLNQTNGVVRFSTAAAQLSLLGISTQSLLKNGITPALEIKAPVNGYIGKVKVNVGKYLNEGDILCEIINKQETLLRLTTYEKDLKDIRLGAKVGLS